MMEKDAEIEAELAASIGSLYYKNFQKSSQASIYLMRAKTVCDTVKDKSFSHL